MSKFLCSFFASFFLCLICSAQEKVNLANPISKVDYYFDEENILQFFTVLNADTTTATAPLIKASITGTVNWDGQSSSQSKFNTQLTSKTNKNEFRYQSIIEDENSSKVKLPNSKNAKSWKSIDNIKMVLVLGNSTQVYQLMPIYSKLNTNTPPTVPKLQIPTSASIISDNEAILKVRTQPEIPFEITNIKLQKGGTNYEVSIDDLNGQNKSLNGLLDLTIPFKDVSLKDGEWGITLIGKAITDGTEMKSGPTTVYFKDEKLISLIQPLPQATTYFTSDEDSKEVLINTQGKGDITVELVSPGLKQIVKVGVTNSGSNYTLKFSNLKNVNDESVDFWITSKNKKISELIKLVKRKATVSDFGFDLSKSDIIAVNFTTPEWINENSLAITIPDRDITIGSRNLSFVKAANTSTKVTGKLSDFIKGKFNEKDTVISANVIIKYGDQSLYNSSVKFINQKLVDAKIQELIAVTTEEKKPNKEKIKKVLDEIVTIAGKVGAAVTNDEVQQAVNQLSEKNDSKEKVNKAMSTIATVGKWFTKLGPILIPLVL